jgi:putative membrane-bound dehydrogenase-like protein
MKPSFFCVLLAFGAQAIAADNIPSKSTYSKNYGETKNPVMVDPAKDLPRYPAVEPKDAVATWKIKRGFQMQLEANEPQVRSPIAVSYDENGRMFVVEMIDYPELRDAKPHLGRISMLEDKDGDGVYETSTVFADDLPWPTGVICANGGIYVIATPDIYFLKDTKGTGKADVREVVFTGFGTGLKLLNVQGLANCPQWGLDNRIHIQAGGGNRGMVKCLKRPDLPEVEIAGHDFWFDPRTYEFGVEAGGGQYGMSFDNYGRRFVCSNSDHLQCFVYDDRFAAKNPAFSMPIPRQSIAADGGAAEVYRISPDEPWRIVRTRWRIAGVVKGVVEGGGRVSGYFTGATGTTVYRGDAYGGDFEGNTFTGDAGGQLVHRKKIYPDGVSFIGRRPDDEQNYEFAASKDTWVRVVNFANAPDGCIHVMDMYREVIEHPWSIPDEIKKYLDLNSGSDRGRLYRIAPDDAQWRRRAGVALGKASTAELVKMLEHPNGWHRDCAARLLYERQDKTAAPMLEALISAPGNSLAKIHALGALDGLDSLSDRAVLAALKDIDPFVRERGVVTAMTVELKRESKDKRTDYEPSFWNAITALAGDPNPRVRFYAALAAGNAGANARAPFLEKLAVADSADSWIGSAILNSADAPLFAALRPSLAKLDPGFAEKLITVIAASKRTPAIDAALLDVVAGDNPNAGWIRAFGEGLKRAGDTIAKVDKDKKLAAVFGKAAETVKDASAPESARIDSIKLLTLATPGQAQPALLSCLDMGQPETIQASATTALGQFSGADVTEAVIGQWPGLRKTARTSAFAVLLARPERSIALLNAIEAKKIASADLTASDVQALFQYKDKAVAALADKALAALKPPTRASVIEKFQPAIGGKGDASRGQTVYQQRCVICHRANDLGIQVGPDLITVKTRGRDGIMTAILDPNKEVASQYIAYTVNTKDGQTLAGIITKDDASSLTLKMMGGAEINIPRANVKGSSSSGQSLMPEGIEAGMTVQEMADLLTFIEGLK